MIKIDSVYPQVIMCSGNRALWVQDKMHPNIGILQVWNSVYYNIETIISCMPFINKNFIHSTVLHHLQVFNIYYRSSRVLITVLHHSEYLQQLHVQSVSCIFSTLFRQVAFVGKANVSKIEKTSPSISRYCSSHL